MTVSLKREIENVTEEMVIVAASDNSQKPGRQMRDDGERRTSILEAV